MNIVHITNFLIPDLGYQELFLAREQVSAGHQVTIITSDLKLSRSEYAVQKTSLGSRRFQEQVSEVDGVRILRLRSRLEISSRVWMAGLEATLNRLLPDLVVVHGISNFNSIRAAWARRRTMKKFKLIYDEHMVYASRRRGPLSRAFYSLYRLFVSRFVQRQADQFIAITPETVPFMENEFGIAPGRVKMVPLGVDLGRFQRDEAERRKLRGEWGLSENHVVVVYAGKIIPEKGVHILFRAALLLWPEHPNLRLLMVGNGASAYVSKLKALLNSAGRSDAVRWVQAVPNRLLYRFYSAADIGVWPAHQSITQLEAAACQLPIIVTNALSLSNRISNANGFSVTPGDELDLAAKIRELLSDSELRFEMGKRSRQLIETTLNWNVLAQNFL